MEKGVGRIKGLGTGFSEIVKRSEEIRTMIADNSRALEDVNRAHTHIQDGLAGVDALIRSILEVSHDMREMTDRLAAAFSWFGETLKLKEESAGALPSHPPLGEAADCPGGDGRVERDSLRRADRKSRRSPRRAESAHGQATGWARLRSGRATRLRPRAPPRRTPCRLAEHRLADSAGSSRRMRTSSPGLTCRRNFAFSTREKEEARVAGDHPRRPRRRTAPWFR